MESLHDIKCGASAQSSPYVKPIKVKIVKSVRDKSHMVLALADTSTSMKAFAYDESIFNKMQTGHTITLKNFKIGRSNALIIGKDCKICKTSPIDVPQSVILEAEQLVEPSTPPRQLIKDTTLKDPGSLVTVEGVIVQDEIPRTVSASTGGTVEVRNMTIEDTSGAVRVALWRDNSSSPVKAGDTVKFTHMSVKNDSLTGSRVLTTTKHTKIQKEIPQPELVTCELLGVEETDDEELTFETLLNETYKNLTMKKTLANKIFGSDNTDLIIELLGEYELVLQGNQIIDTATNN